MAEEIKKDYHPADSNGDGVVSDREHEMYLEFKRKELDDQDAQRDAMRKMTWYASVSYTHLTLPTILRV